MIRLFVALFVALFVVARAASTAAAQAPGSELSLPTFLEKRVSEELASEGHVLSRSHLALKIETAGAIAVISLVDLDTGRAVASTKLDQLPPDREAAVASVTHIAADLLTQIAGREPPPPPTATPPTPPPPAPIVDDRAERAAREIADLKFHKRAIRFGATYDLYVSNTTAVLSRNWSAYRGELDHEIEPQEFYELVGHPELADRYGSRHKFGVGGIVVGSGLMAVAMIYMAANVVDTCFSGDPDYAMCTADSDRRRQDALELSGAMVALGGVSLILGIYYISHPHPVSESEAKKLAEEYNDGIRHSLGLPVVEHHWVHDLHITPYAGHGEGGLALGGRF